VVFRLFKILKHKETASTRAEAAAYMHNTETIR